MDRALRSRRRSSRLVRAAVPAPARVLRHAGLCHQGGGARRLRSLRPRPRGVERAVSGVQGKEESAAARWDKRYGDATAPLFRSEEHTSEIQSLMRLSYAVFSLK